MIDRILVEPDAVRSTFVEDVLERLQGVPVGPGTPSPALPEEGHGKGKRTLHLLNHKGSFLKPCPGTKGYICCGYQILNIGTNCPLDCSYCILQSYVNQPYVRAFANFEEGLERALEEIDTSPGRLFRIGTGEFTDSLALDPLLRWSDRLLPAFASRGNTLLELKTKTDRIERLLSLPERDRIVVSWSLNSPRVVVRDEHRTASLKRRLRAAKVCQEAGFAVGFHFDPLIRHTNWRDAYARTLDLLDRFIDPKGVIWVSMGAFRYMPPLKAVILGRSVKTDILGGEFVPGLDGKMRYFRPLRVELYAFMRERLEQWHTPLGLYLCMESHAVWKEGLGWSPGDSEGLAHFLDARVRAFFG